MLTAVTEADEEQLSTASSPVDSSSARQPLLARADSVVSELDTQNSERKLQVNVTIPASEADNERTVTEKSVNGHSKEIDELRYNLFIFCFPLPILRLARMVAILSTVSLVINLVLVIFGGSSIYGSDRSSTPINYDDETELIITADENYAMPLEISDKTDNSDLNLLVEIALTLLQKFLELLLFAVEFSVILALYYGISHRVAKFLKPYLVFSLIWNLVLFVVWIFCVVELIQRKEEFIFQVLMNTSNFVAIRQSYDGENELSVGIRLSVVLLFVLSLAIIVGFWFWHIILMTYLYLGQQRFPSVVQNGSLTEVTTMASRPPSEKGDTNTPPIQLSSQPHTPPCQQHIENRRLSRRYSRTSSLGYYHNTAYVPYSPPHHYKYQHNYVA